MKREKDIWTASRLKAYHTCPMKEALRYRQKLASISSRPALAFGTAVHKGIETWSIDEGMNALQMPFPGSQSEADEQEIAKVTVEALLRGYMNRFLPFEDHRPEMLFKLPIRTPMGRSSTTKVIAGKIDDLAYLNGQHWIVEYKTASKLDSTYFDRLYVDTQITTYMLAAERMGYRPAGVIYRVLRKPALRKSQKESLEQFLTRLEADISARPEFYFEERTLYRSTADLDAFERQLYYETRLADDLYKKGQCYRHSTACSMYGRCEYLPLCMGEAGAEVLFEIREPNEELRED